MPTASASPLLGCDIHDRWGAVAGQMLIRPDKDKVHAPTASLRSACVAGQAGEDDVQPEGDAGAGVVLQLAGFQDAPEVGVAMVRRCPSMSSAASRRWLVVRPTWLVMAKACSTHMTWWGVTGMPGTGASSSQGWAR